MVDGSWLASTVAYIVLGSPMVKKNQGSYSISKLGETSKSKETMAFYSLVTI